MRGCDVTNLELYAETIYRTALLFDLVRDRRGWDELTLGERQDWIETVRRSLEEAKAERSAA